MDKIKMKQIPCCPVSLADNSNRRCRQGIRDVRETCFCRIRPTWWDHPFWFATRSAKNGIAPAILIHPYSFDEIAEGELAAICSRYSLFYKKGFFVNVWHEDTIPILIHWNKPGLDFQIEGVPYRECP